MASGPSQHEYRRPTQPATFRRWDRSDAAISLALTVLIISLFLPWFGVTEHIRSVSVTGQADGPQAHSYLWAVFALSLIGLIVLVARDAITSIPGNLPSAGQILTGTTSLALALTVLAVATKPGGFTQTFPELFQQVLHFTVSVGWSYGGFIAVLAAATALVTAFTTAGPLQEASRAERAAHAG